MPGALEAARAILIHHVKTGEKLYPEQSNTYTRCAEKVNDKKWRVIVGSSGLHVNSLCYFDDGRIDNGGLGGLRKF